jgi:hypothetical protein
MTSTSKKDDDRDKDVKKQSLYAVYNDLLVTYPLLVNGTQSSIITGLGVITSQIIIGVKQYDYIEIKVMMFINFIFITPILLIFYKQLSKLSINNMFKLIIDQFVFSPLFTFCILSLRLYLLGENHIYQIPIEVLKVLPSVMLSAWLYWIPARFITLTYIPPMFHSLVYTGFTYIYVTLTYMDLFGILYLLLYSVMPFTSH